MGRLSTAGLLRLGALGLAIGLATYLVVKAQGAPPPRVEPEPRVDEPIPAAADLRPEPAPSGAPSSTSSADDEAGSPALLPATKAGMPVMESGVEGLGLPGDADEP